MGAKKKILIAVLTGLGTVVVLMALYLLAPYAGLTIGTETAMVTAAVLALAASAAVLALVILNQPRTLRNLSSLTLGELKENEYAHFPRKSGHNVLYLTIKPDTAIDELGIMEHPEEYLEKEVFLVIRKMRGKDVFNPLLLKKLFVGRDREGREPLGLKDCMNFNHIVLADERGDCIGYIPANAAKYHFTSAAGESFISRFVIDVLDGKESSIILRELDGLSADKDCTFEHERVLDALRHLSEDLLKGLVVFKVRGTDRGFHNPIGVIYASDLIKVLAEIKVLEKEPDTKETKQA